MKPFVFVTSTSEWNCSTYFARFPGVIDGNGPEFVFKSDLKFREENPKEHFFFFFSEKYSSHVVKAVWPLMLAVMIIASDRSVGGSVAGSGIRRLTWTNKIENIRFSRSSEINWTWDEIKWQAMINSRLSSRPSALRSAKSLNRRIWFCFCLKL